MNEKEESNGNEETKSEQEKKEKDEHICCGMKMYKVKTLDGDETVV